MDWSKIWNDIVTFFNKNIWNIITFFIVLFVGIIVIKILLSIIRKILNRTKLEKIMLGFVMAVLKLFLYLCLILALLSLIGVQLTGVLTALSAVLLAVGLALQGIIANAANGLVVVSSKMFKKGDFISVDGQSGSVIEINFLYTTILTTDNKRVTIPNSTIINNSVVDYDSCTTRRVEWKFSVAYETDVEKVKKLILDCIYSNGKVLLEPKPFCRLNALGASSIDFIARCWCDREDYWDVYFDVLELVYEELKRNKISIPYNQIEIRERKDKVVLPFSKNGIPQRVEKVRKKESVFHLENMDLIKFFSREKNKKKKNEKEINRELKLKTNIVNEKVNSKNSNKKVILKKNSLKDKQVSGKKLNKK